jgi:hypothetical protein
MGELEIHQEDFEITITLNGSQEKICVKPEETTDGAEYFKCNQADKNITQIRQEKDGSWEQIWGALDNASIQAIGAAINAHTRKSS